MKKTVIFALMASTSLTVMADDLVTPADMSSEAQSKMYSIVTDYNRCMMNGRLKASVEQQNARAVQAFANDILQSCEKHLDELKLHLTANHIDDSLLEGMTKKLRSRAARQLMTSAMNNMAAQAAAMENAEQAQK